RRRSPCRSESSSRYGGRELSRAQPSLLRTGSRVRTAASSGSAEEDVMVPGYLLGMCPPSRADVEDELPAGVAVLEQGMGACDLLQRQHLGDLERVAAAAHALCEAVQPLPSGPDP